MRKSLILLLVLSALLLSACGAGGEDGSASVHSGNSNSIAENAERPDAEPDAEENNTGVIQAVVSRNCNYVYHMMAVSDCGYVNDYGDTYRSLHPEADLQILKDNERLLTIRGGEHQGDLNFLFMILPASLDDEIPIAEYFGSLADLFGTGEIERNFETYREIYDLAFSPMTEVSLDSIHMFYEQNEPLKAEIAEIATVMRDNYTIYIDEVWEASQAELSAAAAELNRIFAESDFAGRWEEVLDHTYQHDAFYALLCNSMDNGPDCIDVSDRKDVFNAHGEYTHTAQRISHEFGIYILMDMLSDSEFQGYDYWGLKEGLAEYFNITVCGGFPNWSGGEEYIGFYAQLREDNPEITAEEMFRQAVEFYISE